MLRAVIFDVDGTLLLSNDAHARSWVASLAAFGFRVAFEEVRRLIGMGGDKVLPMLVPGLEKSTPLGKAISARRSTIFQTRELPWLRPTPGARELVAAVARAGYTPLVATSAQPAEVSGLLRAAHVADLIADATSSGDAKQSKPDPDIIEAALQRGNVRAEDALMVGDTPYDIESASRAGVPTVAFRTGGWDAPQLRGAAAIFADPADAVVHFDRFRWAALTPPR